MTASILSSSRLGIAPALEVTMSILLPPTPSMPGRNLVMLLLLGLVLAQNPAAASAAVDISGSSEYSPLDGICSG